MAGNESTIKLSPDQQESVIKFADSCTAMYRQNWNLRERMRQVDLAYLREQDYTQEHLRAKLSNAIGDSGKIQNVPIPIVMPQVETAVAYQTEVFLSGVPLFGVVSSSKHVDAAMQLEAKLDADAVRTGTAAELNLAFLDAFRYNMSFVEVVWDSEKVFAVSDTESGVQDLLWSGNKVRRLDPYNVFWDTRVPVTELASKGEFVGYNELMTRIALKDYIAKLPNAIIHNIKAAFESGHYSTDSASDASIDYYVPLLNPDSYAVANTRSSTNWRSWFAATADTSAIEYKNTYLVTTIYGRIIPSDFGLKVPASNTPQIWKFVLVNGSVLIHAERQTNAHRLLPVLTMMPKQDGLSYQSKSMAEHVKPLQQAATAMMNSVLAARRRAIYDRNIYDPSKIDPRYMNTDNPIANIPLRPAAYGTDARTAVFPYPFRDDQSSTLLQEIGQLNNLAETITGQNRAQQGQFIKGNKTREEFSTIMGNASSKPQAISILLESQFFTPLKNILKLNVLQYEGGSSVYSRATEDYIVVDPTVLRQAELEFKVSDGLTPSSKILNLPAFQTAMQVLSAQSPISAGYDVAKLFSYLMKSQGANIGEFEKSKEQLAYEQAAAQWQQVAMMSAEKGAQFNQPQPKPEDYGYNPSGKPVTKGQDSQSILTKFMEAGASNQQEPGAGMPSA